MRQKFLIAMLGATALVSGCATKGYVRQNVTPVQDKINQVSGQVNKVGGDLQKTQQDVAKNTQAISATDEKATGADRRAGDAMTRANQANEQAQKDDQEIAQLRGVVANLDDYKVKNQATVLFKFNSAELSPEDKQQLDQLASNTGSLKRYFIAVEPRGRRCGVSVRREKRSLLPDSYDRLGREQSGGSGQDAGSSREEPARGSKGLLSRRRGGFAWRRPLRS